MSYSAVLIGMRVRMLKNVLVEMKKVRMDEVWDRHLTRWQELNVERIDAQGDWAYLTTYEGDIYLDVPADAFQVISP